MAARALTAAGMVGRRVAAEPALLSSCRSGGAMNHVTSAQRGEENKDVRGAAATKNTGEQVGAALNSKNVEVLQCEEHVATMLPEDTMDIGGAWAGKDASWMPDEETGVFAPADADTAATHGPPGAAAAMPTAGGSVLDQAVFVREEEMEDV